MKIGIFSLSFAVLFCVLIASCHKDQNVIVEPKVSEQSMEVYATQAVFKWTIDYPGEMSSVVEISQCEDMSDSRRFGDENPTNNKLFTVTVEGLESNSKYYYRFLAWNPMAQYEFDKSSFTTCEPNPPIVVTSKAIIKSFSQVEGGGELVSVGGAVVSEYGIYYGTDPDPVANGIKMTALAIDSGFFTCPISDLVEHTQYYLCAFATNQYGTSFGSVFDFVTPWEGALPALFSVSSYLKVYFSKGNLYYNNYNHSWQFVEGQYNTGSFFGWGTGSYPTNTSTLNTGYSSFSDWGNNFISNGGNQAGLWHTLSSSEWEYVFNTRITESGTLYAKACVNNQNGVILLPDDWDDSIYNLEAKNNKLANYTNNNLSESQWAVLEGVGAVFLPAGGCREGSSTYAYGTCGEYWSKTSRDKNYSYDLYFTNHSLNGSSYDERHIGKNVRLVRYEFELDH